MNHVITLLLIAATLLTGCSSPGQSGRSAPDWLDTPRHPKTDVRVLVWNIQRGGNEFDRGPEKALEVIRRIDPDVCLLQESYDIDGDRPELGAWLAANLGWKQWQGESPHLCVLTRWDIRETFFHEPWHALGARVRDDRRREYVVYSTWIDWREYTPHALRDDPTISDGDLLRCETERSERFRQATAIIEHLRSEGHLDGDLPLLVGGDWNCPSHLDWTEDAALVYRFRRALPLPVSRAMAAAGFEDAWRTVHPDPVNQPGITWSPLYRGDAETPETADRIDRLYVHRTARLVPIAAHVIPLTPEPSERAQTDRAFPSDHSAVVMDLAFER